VLKIAENEMENGKNKKLNPKGTMTLKTAVVYLKEKYNVSVSYATLRVAAFRDNFKSKYIGNGREKYLLDEMKFRQWILNTISGGFIPIAKAAKELNITSSYVYVLIKKFKIKVIQSGGKKGKLYVDFKSLKKVCYRKKEEQLK